MEFKIRSNYKRILIKLSGEALQGKLNFGIDIKILNRIALELKTLSDFNIQIGIVIGGGNLLRGSEIEQKGIKRIVGDHMGILSTIMNGLALHDSLQKIKARSYLMSAIPINGICKGYNWEKANNLINKYFIVIFVAGIGNPLFTTDSAACLRSIEIKAEVILKATKVDGVFSKDPKKYPKAIFYTKLSYQDVLEKKLKVMDSTSIILARDNNIPIHVYNMNKKNILNRIINGNKEGTLIT